jgi:uncharacterized protein (DUF362 family)
MGESMGNYTVSLVKYSDPLESVRQAVEMAGGLGRIKAGDKVFIKPNIVFWTDKVPFPKWGVITTSRTIQDMVALLFEHGVRDIAIGEGVVLGRAKDLDTPRHAFNSLGYETLAARYRVKVINTFERPFREVELGEDMKLSYAVDALDSDFIVDVPVMKTHAQTMISLGIKNLKGLIDMNSRKRCHSTDPVRDLHYWVARLAEPLPPVFNLIDGIYTAERGPGFDGKMHRSNLLAASWDVLSADLVGTRLLGQDPAQVPYLAMAAKRAGRPLDLSDIDVKGLKIEDHAKLHQWSFPYTEEGTLPVGMAKMGLKGVSFYKYDTSMCTYCSGINGVVLTAIAMAWKGEPWPDVEILTGKMMQPRPGHESTILLGKCMYQAHKDNPDIKNMVPVKGCPPKPEKITEALHQAGVMVDPNILRNIEMMPGHFMKRYAGKPEFDEKLFQVEA